MDAPRHLVLTAPVSTAPLRHQLEDLRTAFRRLRSTPLWKRTQLGGTYSIEVTRNGEMGLWHPHIHVITDGTFLPHHLARDAWRDCLRRTVCWGCMPPRGACVVDLRKVTSRGKAAEYVAKYVAKPAVIEGWPEDAICELSLAIAGMRMVHTFGTLHNQCLESEDPNESPGAGVFLADLGQVVRRAKAGDPESLVVLLAAKRHGVHLDRYHRLDVDDGGELASLAAHCTELEWVDMARSDAACFRSWCRSRREEEAPDALYQQGVLELTWPGPPRFAK
jgi:hypothetical protein